MNRKQIIPGAVLCLTMAAGAESVTNNLDMQSNLITAYGMVNPSQVSLSFTNYGIRDILVSAGQLCGVDPENGEPITNTVDLLPLKAASLAARGDVSAEGVFFGNGSGISNLNMSLAIPAGSIGISQLSSSIPAVSITTNQIASWDNTHIRTEFLHVLSNMLVVSSNFSVQGTISGDGYHLNGTTAGGNGAFQFNDDGELTGSDRFVFHDELGMPVLYPKDGSFFRIYSPGIVDDANLIYSLRDEDGEAILRMFSGGVTTVVIRANGMIQLTGQLLADGSGITNINGSTSITAGSIGADRLSSDIAAVSITTNDIANWNSGGVLASYVDMAGDAVQILTNLTVQGVLTGNGAGLSHVPAGGTSGSIQYNDNGELAGTEKLLVNDETGKFTISSTDENFFEVYKGDAAVSTNLVYILRRFDDTTEICLLRDGVEKVCLRGDGSVYVGGTLEVGGGLSLSNATTSTGWFIPEEGDLSMGTFTQQ